MMNYQILILIFPKETEYQNHNRDFNELKKQIKIHFLLKDLGTNMLYT